MQALFIISALLSLVGAIGMISHRSPVYSVLFLIVSFFGLAGLFLSLEAEFLSIIQIIVYAGAIMVLFLFVVMLLNLNKEHTFAVQFGNTRSLLAIAVTLLIIFQLATLFGVLSEKKIPAETFAYGKVEPIGKELLTHYLFSFEMISAVLLVALIGAMVIAKKTQK